ncbi:MAG: hypothetical protein JWR60_4027 [Polaromonas sp.]|nr:hypothetical protein [Polaromonas sp.]
MEGSTDISSSGEGTRPTTSGGVDNIGGADGFTPGKKSDVSDTAPAPAEKMAEKRQDHNANRADHPAPLSSD